MATIQTDPATADPRCDADRAPPRTADPPGSVQPDVAVLFVHGIGEQAPGATLHEFGLPLIESAGDWLGADKVTARETAPTDEEPAHAYVTVRDGAREVRFLAAESRWAAVFTPPGYEELRDWLMSTVPFLAQRAFDSGVRRSNARIDQHRRDVREGGLLATLTAGPQFLWHAAWRPVQNVMAVTLSLFVMTLLVAVGLLARSARGRHHLLPRAGATDLPPVGVIARAAAWMARGVTGVLISYIGDSYALLNDAQARARMLARVERDLRWLERHNPAARIVIVAHSQGAELARLVVARRSADQKPIESLITFGSGIKKLAAVKALDRRRGLGWVAFGLRVASAAALTLSLVSLAGTLPLLGDLPGWTAAIGLTVALAALTAARKVLVGAVGDEYRQEDLGVTTAQLTHWLDLYASHDLVSEHSLPLDDLGASYEIVNRRSLLLDHVAYPQNVEAFRAFVALELARAARWPGVTTDVPAEMLAASRRRAARVRWLVRIRAAVAVVALAVIGLTQPTALAGFVVVAVTVGLVVLVSRVWSRWSAGETKKLFPALASAG